MNQSTIIRMDRHRLAERLGALALAFLAIASSVLVASPAGAAVAPASMAAGSGLQSGSHLISSDGRFSLEMQTDGNLVAYRIVEPRQALRHRHHEGDQLLVGPPSGHICRNQVAHRSPRKHGCTLGTYPNMRAICGIPEWLPGNRVVISDMNADSKGGVRDNVLYTPTASDRFILID